MAVWARPILIPITLGTTQRRTGGGGGEDGRVYLDTTVYDGKVAFRPAIVNWRTTAADIELIIDVLRELGRSLSAQANKG